MSNDMQNESEPSSKSVLGIDLGTTNSTASLATGSPGSCVVKTLNIDQETMQGTYTHTLVPSVLALAQGREWTGEGAKRLRGLDTELYKSIFHDCKNDIGLKRTYHKAPEGFRSAVEIAGKVVQFIHEAARAEIEGDFDRVVVTVPASFGAHQRADTLLAGHLSGLELTGGDLLDEPVAAFIDFLATKPELVDLNDDAPQTLLVFDFGGGTCDIAIFRIEKQRNDPGKLNAATLAVSRYHRLGGGDIDAAVLHEVLLPQLLEQNGLSTFDLEYREKKREVEPALLGVAEQLKIKICDEIRKLQGFGKYDDADPSQIVVKQPGTMTLTVAGKALTLTSPTLSAAQFDKTLAPFLDRDLLYARETEYRLTCSIFAPLQDSIDRAALTPRNIDLCLMVGGSSLIPQVISALDEYLPNARVLTYQDKESVKSCVSRGAARHGLMLETTGAGLIAPTCHDDIGIRTAEGAVTLVPRGTVLPYPGKGEYARYEGLVVPQSIQSGASCDLRVELVSGDEHRRLFTEIWNLVGPVNKNDKLLLEYAFDENQVLKLRLAVADKHEAQAFEAEMDKPLSSTVNPHSKRERALEIEEELKTVRLSLARQMEKMIDLAETYADLGQHDKAIGLLKAVMQKKKEPDAGLVNRIGTLYGEKGDVRKKEKFYREAIAIGGSWHGPSFNLALSQSNRGKLQEAAETLDRVLENDRPAPYLVLRAVVAERMMDMPLRQTLLAESQGVFGVVESLDRWELGWCARGASMLADENTKDAAEKEIQRRANALKDELAPQESGTLPMQAEDVERGH